MVDVIQTQKLSGCYIKVCLKFLLGGITCYILQNICSLNARPWGWTLPWSDVLQKVSYSLLWNCTFYEWLYFVGRCYGPQVSMTKSSSRAVSIQYNHWKEIVFTRFTMVKLSLMAWYASKVWRKGFLTFSRNNFERKCEQSVRMVVILLG